MDPIFNTEKVNLIIKSKKEQYTRKLFNHFASIEYMPYMIKQEFNLLKKKMSFNLVILCILLLFFCLGIITTFDYLNYQTLNFIPIIFIFLISGDLVFLILNFIRFDILNKTIHNNKRIDVEFLKLLILKFLHEHHPGFLLSPTNKTDIDRFLT